MSSRSRDIKNNLKSPSSAGLVPIFLPWAGDSDVPLAGMAGVYHSNLLVRSTTVVDNISDSLMMLAEGNSAASAVTPGTPVGEALLHCENIC